MIEVNSGIFTPARRYRAMVQHRTSSPKLAASAAISCAYCITSLPFQVVVVNIHRLVVIVGQCFRLHLVVHASLIKSGDVPNGSLELIKEYIFLFFVHCGVAKQFWWLIKQHAKVVVKTTDLELALLLYFSRR